MIILCGYKCRQVLHGFVECRALCLRYKSHTCLVTLPLRAPKIRIDGLLADSLDVSFSVTHTEINVRLVGYVVLCRGFSDECCYFHATQYKMYNDV